MSFDACITHRISLNVCAYIAPTGSCATNGARCMTHTLSASLPRVFIGFGELIKCSTLQSDVENKHYIFLARVVNTD